MDGLDFYLPAAVLFTAFAAKIPELARNRRDPLLLSMGVLLFVAGLVFLFAAPPTIVAVNDLTGVPNASAPLVYTVLTAFCASCLVLVVHWREERPGRARFVTRWVAGVYLAVIAALWALFLLADAPVERVHDLDTYYATTPYMREMIVLYLVAHLVASSVTGGLCWRWSLRVGGWLRGGLLLLVLGFLLNLGYDAAKFAAVFARWSGRDWDGLSTDTAPPLASSSALLIGLGFLLPRVGGTLSECWRAHRTYRRLGPLWRELHGIAPAAARPSVSWRDGNARLIARESAIHDGLLQLAPHLDGRVRAAAVARAAAEGAGPQRAQAVGDAAMVAAALAGLRTGSVPRDPPGGAGGVPPEGFRDLVGMAQALRTSPVVAGARAATAVRPRSPAAP
ncbi:MULTISPECIES: MAB_1171c family putative transporter [unclassified Streptomyces]|uniref:MAB_1171c family putative transporter n=1 Tax=unclassified Streptomyces TaxID=2593676 RepID=UPI00342A94E6